MLTILRAFAWMRWRMLINSIERTGARDALERFSLAIEQIGPIIVLLLLVPTALALTAAGLAAGFALARGETSTVFEVLRYLLFASTAFAIVGPLLMPGSGRTSAVRLLLLPIPRRVLYLAQAPGALAEPWVLAACPPTLAIAVGLLAGGAPVAAIVALAAGIGLIVVLAGISELATLLLQLVARDRRRGELLALLMILLIPTISLLPGVMHTEELREARSGARRTRQSETPAWAREAIRLAQYTPSELFVSTVRLGAEGNAASASARLAPLAAFAVAVHGLAFLVFGRLLDSPASSGGRRRGSGGAAVWRAIPGLSQAASAIAVAQIRLALRTPRGRSIVLSPLLLFAVFAVLLRRNSGGVDFGFIPLHSGLGLAAFASAICLLSILPFAMNQFAIDGAGLTLVLLSPVRDEELLIGKAVGNGAIAAGPSLICIAVAWALFPSGTPALWIALPLGLASAYVLASPVAAALSLAFPRVVDLNSIGRGSNAQGLAGFLGLVTIVLAGLPPVLLSLILTGPLDRPALAPLVMAAWCAISLMIAYLLFQPVRALLRSRRENLVLIG